MAEADLIHAHLAAIRPRIEAELWFPGRILEELRGHLDDAAAGYEALGFGPDEAQARALAEFGDADELIDTFRETQRGVVQMPSLLSRTGGLAGMLAVLAAGVTLGAYLVQEGSPSGALYAPAGALLAVNVAGIVARAWGRLGRTGRYAAIAIPVGVVVTVMQLAAFSLIGVVLVLTAVFAVAVRLMRLRVLALYPILLFAAGAVLIGVRGLASASGVDWVSDRGIQVAPAAVALVGWFWLSYTLWSERPARLA